MQKPRTKTARRWWHQHASAGQICPTIVINNIISLKRFQKKRRKLTISFSGFPFTIDVDILYSSRYKLP